MAQANQSGGGLARFTLRTIAMIVGVIGAIIALVINILYSLVHVLGKAAGIANDPTHFFWGIFVILVATVGAFLAPILPIAAGLMLLGAGIAFFFIVGWWALFASPFLFVAALLTISNRRVRIPGTA
jgi:hypothetical protein